MYLNNNVVAPEVHFEGKSELDNITLSVLLSNAIAPPDARNLLMANIHDLFSANFLMDSVLKLFKTLS